MMVPVIYECGKVLWYEYEPVKEEQKEKDR